MVVLLNPSLDILITVISFFVRISPQSDDTSKHDEATDEDEVTIDTNMIKSLPAPHSVLV